MPRQQLGILQAPAERRRERPSAAIAVGHRPLDLVAAATTLPLGEDHFRLADARRGESFPRRVARASRTFLDWLRPSGTGSGETPAGD